MGHIVSSFDDDLRDLVGRIGEMGGLVEQQVQDAVTSLLHSDKERAELIIKKDKDIDVLDNEISETTVRLIVRRQPMAGDLRSIVAAMRISHDLERVGDLAKNIAKRTIAIDQSLSTKRLASGVEHMADLALKQVSTALDAYGRKDDQKACLIRTKDEEIDALYTSLFRELLTYMMEDPRNISSCTHLLFCAKNIERIGDHATNIAEQIHYVVTGELIGNERPKNDSANFTIINTKDNSK